MNKIIRLLKKTYINNLISLIVYILYLVLYILIFSMYERIVSTISDETLRELLLNEGSPIKLYLLVLFLLLTIPFLFYFLYYTITDNKKYKNLITFSKNDLLLIMLEVVLYISLTLMTFIGYFIVFSFLSINNIYMILFVLLTLGSIYISGLIIKIN